MDRHAKYFCICRFNPKNHLSRNKVSWSHTMLKNTLSVLCFASQRSRQNVPLFQFLASIFPLQICSYYKYDLILNFIKWLPLSQYLAQFWWWSMITRLPFSFENLMSKSWMSKLKEYARRMPRLFTFGWVASAGTSCKIVSRSVALFHLGQYYLLINHFQLVFWSSHSQQHHNLNFHSNIILTVAAALLVIRKIQN